MVAVLVESADNGNHQHTDMLVLEEVVLAWAEGLELEQDAGAEGKAVAPSEVL